MGSVYITEMVHLLDAAGLICRVTDVNEGWEYRSRSSGGFNEMPLGIVWHHTASTASPENDLNYMIHNSDNRPVGNMLIDREGICWPIAAGAANTQGKGGPTTFSRGTCPLDQGNTQLWGIEVANSGVGEMWPSDQIDAYFVASNVLNEFFGNQPDDVVTHHVYAPDRKIDPATAAAVDGWWVPRSVNSSGTWKLADIKNECLRRATPTPPTIPPTTPPGDTDMASSVLVLEDGNAPGAIYRCDGVTKTWVKDGNMSAQVHMRVAESEGGTRPAVDGFVYTYMKNGNLDFIASCGPIVGPRPEGHDEYGRH